MEKLIKFLLERGYTQLSSIIVLRKKILNDFHIEIVIDSKKYTMSLYYGSVYILLFSQESWLYEDLNKIESIENDYILAAKNIMQLQREKALKEDFCD